MSDNFNININNMFKEQENRDQEALYNEENQSEISDSSQQMHSLDLQQLQSQLLSYYKYAFKTSSSRHQQLVYKIQEVRHNKYSFITFSNNGEKDNLQPVVSEQDSTNTEASLKDEKIFKKFFEICEEQLSKQNPITQNQQQYHINNHLKRTNIFQFLKKKGLNIQAIRKLLRNTIRRFLFYEKQINLFRKMCSHTLENSCPICQALQASHYQQKFALIHQYFPKEHQLLWKQLFPYCLCIYDQVQVQDDKNNNHMK